MLLLLAPPLPLRLISYELLQDSPSERMRVIISSQFLYFFRRSPPDPSSLEARFSLDSIVEDQYAATVCVAVPLVYLYCCLHTLLSYRGENCMGMKLKFQSHTQTSTLQTVSVSYPDFHTPDCFGLIPRLSHSRLFQSHTQTFTLQTVSVSYPGFHTPDCFSLLATQNSTLQTVSVSYPEFHTPDCFSLVPRLFQSYPEFHTPDCFSLVPRLPHSRLFQSRTQTFTLQTVY